MEMGLANKTALVTGGSRGIGLETARALAREGVKVLICARRESALADAAREIMRTTQTKIETHPLDVTKLEQIEMIPRIIGDKLGRIDILVNNAGTGTYKPFLEVTDEELVEGMAINFFAQFRICQRIVPMMIAQGGGRIVNVSGQTGIMTLNPPFLSSCTGPAKSAEIRFSKVLARTCAAQYPRQLRDTGLHQYAGALRQMGTRTCQAPARSRGCRPRAITLVEQSGHARYALGYA